MIDFHCHLLPDMDDGSSSVEESLQILTSLSQQNVEKVVATPHFIANNESVDEFLYRRKNSYESLKPKLHKGLPEIRLGAEVEFYNGISNLEGLKKLCAENTDILLLEMPNEKWTQYTVAELFRLVSDGSIRIMLAHIERCLFLQDRDVVEYLLDNDVIMQSNASYFINTFTKRKACKRLSEHTIHVLGSDSHNMTTRPPKIKEAVDFIRKKLGNESIEYIDLLSKEFV